MHLSALFWHFTPRLLRFQVYWALQRAFRAHLLEPEGRRVFVHLLRLFLWDGFAYWNLLLLSRNRGHRVEATWHRCWIAIGLLLRWHESVFILFNLQAQIRESAKCDEFLSTGKVQWLLKRNVLLGSLRGQLIRLISVSLRLDLLLPRLWILRSMLLINRLKDSLHSQRLESHVAFLEVDFVTVEYFLGQAICNVAGQIFSAIGFWAVWREELLVEHFGQGRVHEFPLSLLGRLLAFLAFLAVLAPWYTDGRWVVGRGLIHCVVYVHIDIILNIRCGGPNSIIATRLIRGELILFRLQTLLFCCLLHGFQTSLFPLLCKTPLYLLFRLFLFPRIFAHLKSLFILLL